MKKFFVALAISSFSLMIAAPVMAAKGNPHLEEQDGCDHGHTGKPCKPDPQPTHGKDCVKHGNHGGINEDHCLNPTTTTTQPVITTTTVPTTIITTNPTVPVTITINPTNPTSPVLTDAPTSSSTGSPAATGNVATEVVPTALATGQLAHTGVGQETVWLALFGFGSLGLGISIRRLLYGDHS